MSALGGSSGCRWVGVAGAVLAAAAFAGCGDDASRDRSDAPASVEEVYARMAGALGRPGEILHTTATVTLDHSGDERPDHRTVYWIDIAEQRARSEYTLDPSVDSYDRVSELTVIYFEGFAFVPDDEDEALRQAIRARCVGTEDWILAVLLDCGDSGIESRHDFGPPRLVTKRGGGALSIVREADRDSEHATLITEVDATTYLPRDKRLETSQSNGEALRTIVRYEHEFVRADSVAADFMDPRSIGYGADPPPGEVRDAAGRDVPVYWVGDEYTRSVEEYVLARVPEPLHGEAAYLVYETPRGLPGFEILVFAPDAWDEFLRSDTGTRLSNEECVPRSTLPGIDAALYTIPWPEFPVSQTPQTPEEVCDLVVAQEPPLVQWGHLAVVRLDGAVVAVGDASGTAAADTGLLEAIVPDLVRR